MSQVCKKPSRGFESFDPSRSSCRGCQGNVNPAFLVLAVLSFLNRSFEATTRPQSKVHTTVATAIVTHRWHSQAGVRHGPRPLNTPGLDVTTRAHRKADAFHQEQGEVTEREKSWKKTKTADSGDYNPRQSRDSLERHILSLRDIPVTSLSRSRSRWPSSVLRTLRRLKRIALRAPPGDQPSDTPNVVAEL